MFTGIIEEMGTIAGIRRTGGSVILKVSAPMTSRGLRKGESIAVNGVCLTVIGTTRGAFSVQAVEETLRKTNLGSLERGKRVNLERPMSAYSRFGGHFVLGHCDTTGTVVRVQPRASSRMVWIDVPRSFKPLLIPAGSVTVDGVSLTVAALESSRFGVSIIPHTWKVTTFQDVNRGDRVNVEFDVLGKYVLNMQRGRRR